MLFVNPFTEIVIPEKFRQKSSGKKKTGSLFVWPSLYCTPRQPQPHFSKRIYRPVTYRPKKLFSIARDDTGIRCVYAPNVRRTTAPSCPLEMPVPRESRYAYRTPASIEIPL